VPLAAARALRSSYCCLAHARVLRDRFYPADQVAAMARDYTPADVAMMTFAERVARDASAISAADVQALRDLGFGDADIFDVAAAAAARCFFSKLLDALGAEPDSTFLQVEDGLRQSLTVGRPIGREPTEELPEPATT
jgi:alkylhydroperoxidase family enzyme